jgi:hypothetical protein
MRLVCLVIVTFAACRAAPPEDGIQVVLPMEGHYGTSAKHIFRAPVFVLEEPKKQSLGMFYDGSGRAAVGISSNIRVSEWVTEHLIRALRADVVNAYRVDAFPSRGIVLSGKIVECSVETEPKDPMRVTGRLWVRFIVYKDGNFCRKAEFSQTETWAYLSQPTENVLTLMLRSILRDAVPELVRILMAH